MRDLEAFRRALEAERDDLLEALLVAEAAEAAGGARHLTVVLGEIYGPGDLDRWAVMLGAVRRLAAGHHRWRLVHNDDTVSVTVWGPGADAVVMQLSDVAHRLDAVDVRESLW